MTDLQKMYRRRFGKEIKFRKQMYRILCKYYQRFIPNNATVLDVAAGYCEFINNIKAKRKIALDLNPDIKNMAGKDVEIIISPSTDMKWIKDGSVDFVHISNFLEHITKKDIIQTIKEVKRVLKIGGRLLILQPNIRYCNKDYWMFFDHITPLDDRCIIELLETNGFKILFNKDKFLPYSTKSRLPNSILLLKIYLKLSILQRLFGKQALILSKKKQ